MSDIAEFFRNAILSIRGIVALIATVITFLFNPRIFSHMPCTVTIYNQADVPLVFLESAGDSWTSVPSQGTVVEPGKNTATAFQISTPGFLELAHWGWLYFSADVPEIGSKMFLVYAEVSTLSINDKCGAGPCNDTNSSTRDNPFPQGQFGMTQRNSDYNKMEITIFNKDLWSTELSPASWMDDLVRLRPSVIDWPLSKFKYPGQHDAGSFGNKQHSNYATAWSWQCNDKNMYRQALSGVRWFDLRLCKREGLFWPFHGFSEQTGDPLVQILTLSSALDSSEETLVGQILKFVDEQPNEVIIIQVKFKRGTPIDEAWTTIYESLGDRLIPYPKDNKTPTLRSVRGQQRRIIIYSDHRRWPPSEKNAWIMQYIWDYKNRDVWRGTVWNQGDWDKSDMSLVVRATEAWMRTNIHSSHPHIFWWAQCQLTPSFMHPDFFLYPSRSPKTLAKLSNPYTREYITNRDLYKQNGSILSMDWATDDENMAIAAMNFDTAREILHNVSSTNTATLPNFTAAQPTSEPFVSRSRFARASRKLLNRPNAGKIEKPAQVLNSMNSEAMNNDPDESDEDEKTKDVKEKRIPQLCCW